MTNDVTLLVNSGAVMMVNVVVVTWDVWQLRRGWLAWLSASVMQAASLYVAVSGMWPTTTGKNGEHPSLTHLPPHPTLLLPTPAPNHCLPPL